MPDKVDIDYYKIVPSVSGKYNFSVTNRNVSRDIGYELYSQYGEKLESKNYIGQSESDKITYEVQAGTIYYLKVSSYGSGTYSVSYANSFPFTDVPVKEGNWKYEAVRYVSEEGVMTGVKPTLFYPDALLTRAQFASVLYRMAGSPYVYYQSVFSDVPRGQWYTDAVIWAYKNGIVAGYSDGRFGINDNITREQAARMLYLYSAYKGNTVSMRGDISSFPDSGQVSGWAKEQVQWAVAMNMMSGKTVNGKLQLVPKGTTSRAECASMISRYLKNS